MSVVAKAIPSFAVSCLIEWTDKASEEKFTVRLGKITKI